MSPAIGRRAHACLLFSTLLALAGCGAVTEPTSAPTRPAVSNESSARVSASPPFATSTVSPTTIEVHEVAPSATELLQDYRTDGTEIVFSSGPVTDPQMTAPDLYRYSRQTGERELIFANPDRDSYLLPVAVGDGQYAFAELNERLYGPDGWGLWYMSSGSVTPRLLDQSDREQEMPSPIPLMALSGDRLVWQAFHQTTDGPRSQLLLAELPDGDKEVLLSADPVSEAQYWSPSLDGDRLVYSVVDYAKPDTPRYVYLVDLADPEGTPRRLDTSGRAVTPAIHGDNVVWKEADDVFDWGTIASMSISDGTISHPTFGTQTELNYPSVGNRFIAAWGRDYGVVYIYDLERREPVLVEQWPQSPPAISVRPVVGGDVLLWVSSIEPDDTLHLKWCDLPSLDSHGSD